MENQQKSYNLLFVTPEYPPHNVGGGGFVYQRVAEGLAKKGYKVTVLAGDHTFESSNDKPVKEIINGVTLYRLPLIPNKSGVGMLTTRTPLNKNSKKQIIEVLNNEKFDLAICYSVLELTTIYASRLLRKLKVPYFICIQGYPDISLYSLPIKLLFLLYKTFLMLPYTNAAKKIITTSDNVASYLSKNVIPNGIDFKELVTINSKLDIRRKHNIPSNHKIIFSLGRLEVNKGYQYVIPAIKQLENVTYLIGGPDMGYKPDLDRLIGKSDNIILIGKLSTEEKKNYFAQSDLFVMPSLVEAFGIVALEALAFGLPVVVNPVGGLMSFLKDHENSLYLDDIRNPIDVAEKIATLLYDRNLIETFKVNSQKIISKYEWDNIINDYESEIIDFFENEKTK